MNKTYEVLYKELKEALTEFEVPRDENLITIKLKEVFQIDSCDINIETIMGKETYEVRYQDIQVYLTIDRLIDRFIVSPRYDVFNELDEIIN